MTQAQALKIAYSIVQDAAFGSRQEVAQEIAAALLAANQAQRERDARMVETMSYDAFVAIAASIRRGEP